jgi:DNA-binding PadR family transcriptional regulator
MNNEIQKYLPLTETSTYILFALTEPMHGYVLMQKVEQMSEGTVVIGPGTLYTAFSTMEKEGLIVKVDEHDRRKSYALTEKGKRVLTEQIRRSEILVRNGLSLLSGLRS